jgi:hypothetical protein
MRRQVAQKSDMIFLLNAFARSMTCHISFFSESMAAWLWINLSALNAALWGVLQCIDPRLERGIVRVPNKKGIAVVAYSSEILRQILFGF